MDEGASDLCRTEGDQSADNDSPYEGGAGSALGDNDCDDQ